ncbi:hypothetical protein Nans01_23790 [Nocardiopsis ansamitocini]|uniref:Uncharacterized protein n=1 Tax=Nocardiopsis ansamitocini TaxID=1670832 RepID=A0A9W6P6N6_9ACTN|nr:hypothetical protein Nans01_23790 [Nocardiopsis ansamitocini]
MKTLRIRSPAPERFSPLLFLSSVFTVPVMARPPQLGRIRSPPLDRPRTRWDATRCGTNGSPACHWVQERSFH